MELKAFRLGLEMEALSPGWCPRRDVRHIRADDPRPAAGDVMCKTSHPPPGCPLELVGWLGRQNWVAIWFEWSTSPRRTYD